VQQAQIQYFLMKQKDWRLSRLMPQTVVTLDITLSATAKAATKKQIADFRAVINSGK